MCEKSTKYARGTVWWVDTIDDSMCSTSQKGRRPFLIISNNEFNRRFGKVTVIPMSHQDKYENYEFTVATLVEGKKCYALADQIRQIDTNYLRSYAYTLNSVLLEDIDTIVAELYTGISVSDFETSENSVSNEETISSNTNNNIIDGTLDNIVESYNVQYDLSMLEARLDGIDNKIANLSSSIDKHTEEFIRLATILNDAITSMNNRFYDKGTIDVKKEIDTKTPNKKTDTIKFNKSNKSNKKTANKVSKKSKASMGHGFYSDVKNNIDFWNDMLVEGETFVRDKYGLKDKAAFSRRKSRVKIFLTNHGYDTTDIIVEG